MCQSVSSSSQLWQFGASPTCLPAAGALFDCGFTISKYPSTMTGMPSYGITTSESSWLQFLRFLCFQRLVSGSDRIASIVMTCGLVATSARFLCRSVPSSAPSPMGLHDSLLFLTLIVEVTIGGLAHETSIRFAATLFDPGPPVPPLAPLAPVAPAPPCATESTIVGPDAISRRLVEPIHPATLSRSRAAVQPTRFGTLGRTVSVSSGARTLIFAPVIEGVRRKLTQRVVTTVCACT